MSLDFAFAASLLVKMGVAAAFVVAASLIAERAGPLVGAMVSTLPISAGPAYVFLALDHEPTFIAASALASLAINAVTVMFALTYAALAQRRSLAVSLAGALALWSVAAFAAENVEWSLARGVIFNGLVFAICIPVAHRFQQAKMPFVRGRWYDVPLRAAMVACLVAIVVGLSSQVGSAITGMLAVFPIVLTSLILILQPRIGGAATAAVIAHGIVGLVGFAIALVALNLGVTRIGAPGALCLALAVSLGWNMMIWKVRRRAAAR